ncbi:MAG TPA: TIGR03560 family F420-dependent LLM class oxidoreductase [Dehalococcoidia bacterium]|nr:TIGR03560 family F420-dependent LLM class oxidoreductase [Dehalococcoidia bacterium]
MDIAIMIEGQNGLNWPRWQRIVRAVEDLGFAGLFRSDHVTNPRPPDLDSLELWTSLTWAASNTSRIQFGPLVTPASLHHPVNTARMAAAVDDLSGGRLVLGLGAGWTEREHANYGFELLDVSPRFRRLEEALEVITRLLRSDTPSSFEGEFYRLSEAILLPRPGRPGGPPILIGGNGTRRTLPLAARFASEWNAVYVPREQYRSLNAKLDALLEDSGRQPKEVRRSLMTGVVYGKDRRDLERKLQGRPLEQLRSRVFVGTGKEIAEQLAEFAQTGASRVMLQWLDLDDIDGLNGLAKAVLP